METALSRFWLEYVGAVFMQSWLVITVALMAWIALRKRSAALRYAVLALALVKLLLPPSAVWPVDVSIPRHSKTTHTAVVEAGAPRFVEQQPSAQATGTLTERTAAQQRALGAPALKMAEFDMLPATPVVRKNSFHFSQPGSSTLLAIWLIIVAVLFILQGWRIWAVHRRLLARVAGTDSALSEAIERAARALGVRRPVEGLVSHGTEGPVVLGLLRPRIIMPSGMLRTLSRGELDALLLHEMAHVRRHDLAVNLAQTALQILWFFHPGVWVLNALVRREREMACDDLAIAYSSNERKDFVAGIMKALGANAGAVACAPCLLGFLELRAGVFQRLKRIITRRTVGKATVGVRESVLLALAALVVLPLAVDARAGREAGRYAQYLNTRWVGSFSARGDRTYGFWLTIDRVRGNVFSGALASTAGDEQSLHGLGYAEGCFRGDTVMFSRLEQLGDSRDVPINDSFVGVRTGDRIVGRWDLPGFEARRGSTFELIRDTAFERLPDTIAGILNRCRDMRRGKATDGLAMQLDRSRLEGPRIPEEWWTRMRPGSDGSLGDPRYDTMDSLLGAYIGSILGPQAHADILAFQALHENAMGRDPLYRLWKRSFATLDTALLSGSTADVAVLRSFVLAYQLSGSPHYALATDSCAVQIDAFIQAHPEVSRTSVATVARVWLLFGPRSTSADRNQAQTLLAGVPVDSISDPTFLGARFGQTMTTDPTSALLALRRLSDLNDGSRLEWALHRLFALQFGWQQERQNVFRFSPMLDAMGDTRWAVLAEASSGLRTWLAARAVEDDPRDLARIAQLDFGGPRSRSDRYCLLLSDLLARHGSTRELAAALVDRAIREVRDSLEVKSRPASGYSPLVWTPQQRTAIYRLVLACAHYRRAQLCGPGEEDLSMEHRRLAAEAYLDTAVWQHQGAIGSDLYLLRTADYAAEYALALETAGRKGEALAVLERGAAIVDPSLLDRVVHLRSELGMPVDEFRPQLRWDNLPRLQSVAGLVRLDSTPVDIGTWAGKWVLVCPAATWADNGKLGLWREPLEWYERSGRDAGCELILLLSGWASDQDLDSLRRDASDLPIVRDVEDAFQNANIQGAGFSRSLVTPKGRVVYLPNSDDWSTVADALIESMAADTTTRIKPSLNAAPQTTVTRSSTTGARTRESLAQTVIANLGELREAYNSQLRSTPGLQGKAVVKFAISDRGAVIFSQTIESTLGSAELDSTVARLVSKWQFVPIDKEGDVTEVVYPFTFSQ